MTDSKQTLIEKVAQSIHSAWLENEDVESQEDWPDVFDKSYWRNIAKAAINTMESAARGSLPESFGLG